MCFHAGSHKNAINYSFLTMIETLLLLAESAGIAHVLAASRRERNRSSTASQREPNIPDRNRRKS